MKDNILLQRAIHHFLPFKVDNLLRTCSILSVAIITTPSYAVDMGQLQEQCQSNAYEVQKGLLLREGESEMQAESIAQHASDQVLFESQLGNAWCYYEVYNRYRNDDYVVCMVYEDNQWVSCCIFLDRLQLFAKEPGGLLPGSPAIGQD